MKTPLWHVPHHAFALFSSSASLQFEEEGDEAGDVERPGPPAPVPAAATAVGSARHGPLRRFIDSLASSVDGH